jgi:hypothetical protein
VDGKVLAGGFFTMLAGQLKIDVGRLSNTATATQTLSMTASNLTWLRGGTGPEIWRATFASSSNGTDWVSLGDGSRISGGWELDGVSVPPANVVRARGFVAGAYQNGSGWFVQDLSRPLILTGDSSLGFRTNGFSFEVMGSLGRTGVVEASADLANWSAVSTNVFGGGAVYFTDPASSGLPRRFYGHGGGEAAW